MKWLKNIINEMMRYIILFLTYGLIYFIIECVFKRHLSDYRMALLGGFLGVCIGIINNAFSFETDLILQGIIGVISVTLAEAIFGYQWNIVQGLHIWDYSSLRFNGVGGQVCLEFSLFAWFPLSIFCIILDDLINYYWFKLQPCPYYKIGGKVVFRFKEK